MGTVVEARLTDQVHKKSDRVLIAADATLLICNTDALFGRRLELQQGPRHAFAQVGARHKDRARDEGGAHYDE